MQLSKCITSWCYKFTNIISYFNCPMFNVHNCLLKLVVEIVKFLSLDEDFQGSFQNVLITFTWLILPENIRSELLASLFLVCLDQVKNDRKSKTSMFIIFSKNTFQQMKKKICCFPIIKHIFHSERRQKSIIQTYLNEYQRHFVSYRLR